VLQYLTLGRAAGIENNEIVSLEMAGLMASIRVSPKI
jgi:hypothetical protein